MSLTFMQWKLQTFCPQEDLASWLVFRYFGHKVRAQCNSHNWRNNLNHLLCRWGVSERKSLILHELSIRSQFPFKCSSWDISFSHSCQWKQHYTHTISLAPPKWALALWKVPLRGSRGIDILKWTTWVPFFIRGYETSQRWPTIF